MGETRTPMERLAAGYDATGADTKRRDRLARIYRPDPMLERLIALRASDPARYARALTPDLQIGLGLYEAQKAAYQEVHGNDDDRNA